MHTLLLKARSWLGPDVLDDEDRQRIARLNLIFLVGAGVLTALRMLTVVRTLPDSAPLVAIAVLALPGMALLVWSRRLGRVRLTAYLTAALFWLVINVAAVLAGGVDRPLFATNVTVLIFVALTLGARTMLVFAAASVLAGLAMYFGRLAGLVHAPASLAADFLV